MTKAEKQTKDELEAWWSRLTGEPFPVRSESAGSRFSIDEIDEWLKGWILLDVGETPNEALSIALSLLRDDEDGIETYFEEKPNVQCEPPCEGYGHEENAMAGVECAWSSVSPTTIITRAKQEIINE